MLQRMLKHDPVSLSCLQRILTGGAALSPTLAQVTLEQLGPVIFNLYGTSEAGFCILGTPALLGRKPASIGQPVWGVRAKIVNSAEKEVSNGKTGRLFLRSAWSTHQKSWIETGDFVAVASAAYLEKFGEPQEPTDLLHHNCIVYPRQSTGNEWHFRGTTVTVGGNLQVNNSMALREAVLANIGIGTSPIWSFSDELQNQSVKVILKEYEPEPIPIQVVYRRGRFQSAKVKCFIDFLCDEFKAGLS